jgi:hypothetical protein
VPKLIQAVQIVCTNLDPYHAKPSWESGGHRRLVSWRSHLRQTKSKSLGDQLRSSCLCARPPLPGELSLPSILYPGASLALETTGSDHFPEDDRPADRKGCVESPQLARESGLCQQSLSRWLQEARSPPLVGSDKRIERWGVALAEDGQASVAITKRIPSWPAKTKRWLKRPHCFGRAAAKTPLSHPDEQLRASRAKSGVLVSASFKSNLARGKSARPVQDNSKSRSKSRKTPHRKISR